MMLKSAKKATAFVTSFMMMFTGGLAETLAAISASAANASTMYIYDEKGNDISSNPIIYLDNSTYGGGKTSTTVKVAVDSPEDTIVYATDSASSKIIGIEPEYLGNGEVKLTLDAAYDKTARPNDGTAKVTLTTSSGEVYRNLTVVAYNPANCLTMKYGDTELFTDEKGKHSCTETTVGVLAVANHKYQFTGQAEAKSTANSKASTDQVEYEIVDGVYNGSGTKPAVSDKAEIDDSGLFTPKKNGTVTVIAKFKPTETSKREKAEYVPKYIQVIIIKENPATALKFNNPVEALGIGETYQLDLEKTPTYESDTGATDVITWTSSNEKVLTVDDKGLVTAVGKGTATIMAKAENDTVFTACDISVITKATSIAITPSPTSTRVSVGTELTATMSPATANDELIWTSSDERIASVRVTNSGKDENVQKAIITGKKKGTAVITVKAKNSNVEAKCTVTVTDRIASDNLTVSYAKGDEVVNVAPDGTVDLYTLNDITFDAVLKADDGSTPDDEIVWQVLNNENDYITINKKDNKSISIHAASPGTVTLKASSSANSAISQTFKVTVLKACDKAVIKDAATEKACTGKSLNVGNTLGLTVDYTIEGNYPYNHDDVLSYWESSDDKIATVNSKGVVTAVSNGTARITAYSASGKKVMTSITVFTTSSVTISGVTASPDGSSLPSTTIALAKDGTGKRTMGRVVRNQNNQSVSNCDVVWLSSNSDVATIDNSGVVTAHDVGVTTITLRSGSKSESCLLYVTYAATNFTIDAIPEQVYSPLAQEYVPLPVVTIPAMNKELVKDVDYTIEYVNNTKVGTATVKIAGIDPYTSTKSVTFKIVKRPLTDAAVVVDTIDDQQYTGTAITPEPVVKCQGVILKKGTDYTVRYSNNTKVGTATVTITGAGNYTGSTAVSFDIKCAHKNSKVTITKEATCEEDGSAVYDCSDCKQKVTEVIPKLGHNVTSYTVTKQPTLTAAGTKTGKCTRCGKTVSVSIPKLVNISSATVTLSAQSYAYTGTAKKPSVTVKLNGTTLKSGTDYTVSYKNNTNAGTATVTVTGKGAYGGTASKNFAITAASLSNFTITVGNGSGTEFFRGTRIKPVVKVTNGTTVIPSTNYTVVYLNNLSVGTATVKITGKNGLKGTVTKTFDIVQRSIANCDVEFEYAKYYFTGARLKPNFKVYCNGVEMYSGNYTAVYSNNLTAGTATVTLTGMKNLKGTVTKTFKILPRSVSGCTVNLTKNTSNKYKPNVSVAYYGREIYSGNYTVSYSAVKNGQVTVKITGKNSLSGTVTKTYTVS